MKKKIIALVLAVLAMVCMLTACGNMALFDTTYTFDKAIIEMPGGEVIEVKVKTWQDYDGEQLQIMAEDGTVYLVSSYNCVLISSK